MLTPVRLPADGEQQDESSTSESHMIRNRSLLFIFAILGATSSACSIYVDSDRHQCKVQKDCQAFGSAYAAYECKDSICQAPEAPVDQTWTCLDAPSETVTGSVHVNITLVDLVKQTPLEGVTLSLCAKIDGDCSLPLQPQYVSNSAGQIDVVMPAGFAGYFQADGAGIYPSLIFPPSTRKQRAPSTIPLMAYDFYKTMMSGVKATVAADRSVILMTALDCLGRPAAGLQLSSPDIDDQTVSYLIAGGMPSRTVTVTDESGNGGFVNVPTGSVIINSTLEAGNRPVGTAGVQARAGRVSMAIIMPNGS
jgi:hypothetical protein